MTAHRRSDTAFRAARHCGAILAVCLSLHLPAAGARADQSDPRLDRLFAVLQTATERTTLEMTEGRIWAIWAQAGDAGLDRLMADGIRAISSRRLPDAHALFAQLVERAPDFAEGWNKRATVRYLMGDLEGSLEDIARTVELEPRHFGAYSGKGLVLSALGRDTEALKAFEHALRLNPRMPGPRRNAEALRRKLGLRPI